MKRSRESEGGFASGSLAERLVKRLETFEAALQQLVVVEAGLRPALEHSIKTDALGHLIFPILQVGIVHHPGDFQHGLVRQAESLYQRLERAVLAMVRKLDLE